MNYLLKQIEARTPMVLKLVGGELLHGVIEYYDRDLIKVARRGAPSILVRKRNIVYMYKDEALPGSRGHDPVLDLTQR